MLVACFVLTFLPIFFVWLVFICWFFVIFVLFLVCWGILLFVCGLSVVLYVLSGFLGVFLDFVVVSLLVVRFFVGLGCYSVYVGLLCQIRILGCVGRSGLGW